MALLELSFADTAALSKEGRHFNCETCPDRIKKLRRCGDDRLDFNEGDGSIWPMYVTQGGGLYGFCPAKATWDVGVVERFRLLVLSCQLGVMINDGGLTQQPDWFVEDLAWFAPCYDSIKFSSRVKAVLGDGKHGGDNKGLNRPNSSRHK